MKPILNAKGQPFSDPDAAALKAQTMTDELGEEFTVVAYQNGFAVIAKGSAAREKVKMSARELESVGAEVESGWPGITTDEMQSPPSTVGSRTAGPKSQIARDYEARKTGGGMGSNSFSASAVKPLESSVAAAHSSEYSLREIKLRPAWRCFWRLHALTIFGFLMMISPVFTIRSLFLFQISPSSLDFIYDHGLVSLFRLIGVSTALMTIAVAMTRYYSRQYILGSNTVESIIGIFARRTVRIEYLHIRSVDVNQTYMGRALDFGDVDLSTANTAGLEVSFFGVKDPMAIQEEIYHRKKLVEKKTYGTGMLRASSDE